MVDLAQKRFPRIIALGTGVEQKRQEHASPLRTEKAQPHQQPSPGDAAQHDQFAAEARGHHDHAAQGEGVAPRGRADDHAGQDRHRRQPPSGVQPPARPRHGQQAVQRTGPALRQAERRLPAHPEIRVPPGRQRAHGAGRTHGPSRGCGRFCRRGSQSPERDWLRMEKAGRAPAFLFCREATMSAHGDPVIYRFWFAATSTSAR